MNIAVTATIIALPFALLGYWLERRDFKQRERNAILAAASFLHSLSKCQLGVYKRRQERIMASRAGKLLYRCL